jgi:serine protease inhibitor
VFQALEMFYNGRNFSMVIVLPNENDGVLRTANNLQNAGNFKKVLGSMGSNKVKVYVPPFEINTSTDLTTILKQVSF